MVELADRMTDLRIITVVFPTDQALDGETEVAAIVAKEFEGGDVNAYLLRPDGPAPLFMTGIRPEANNVPSENRAYFTE